MLTETPPPEFEEATALFSDDVGTTFRAREGRSDAVAVTLLKVALTERQERRRLRADILSASALADHPRVLPLHRVEFTAENRPYVVTAVPPAESLADRLARHGPLPIGDVARIGRDVADALTAAHERGVLHLDLRPGTVFVDAQEHAVVTGFGVVHAVAQVDPALVPASGMVHAPRELFGWETPGPPADVHGLASLLYELLAGRAAYAPEARLGRPALYQRVLRGDPPPIPRPDLPPALADLLARMMAPDPARRPPLDEARRLLDDLATDPRTGRRTPAPARGPFAPAPTQAPPSPYGGRAAPAPPPPAYPSPPKPPVPPAPIAGPPAAPAPAALDAPTADARAADALSPDAATPDASSSPRPDGPKPDVATMLSATAPVGAANPVLRPDDDADGVGEQRAEAKTSVADRLAALTTLIPAAPDPAAPSDPASPLPARPIPPPPTTGATPPLPGPPAPWRTPAPRSRPPEPVPPASPASAVPPPAAGADPTIPIWRPPPTEAPASSGSMPAVAPSLSAPVPVSSAAGSSVIIGASADDDPQPHADAPAEEDGRSRRRWPFVLVLLVVAAGLALVAGLVWGAATRGKPSAGAATPSPTQTIAPTPLQGTLAEQYQPTAVGARSTANGVLVSWQSPGRTDGVMYFYVLQERDGSAQGQQVVEPAAQSVAFTNLTPGQEYCYSVTTMVQTGPDAVGTATAPRVCTTFSPNQANGPAQPAQPTGSTLVNTPGPAAPHPTGP